MEVLLNSGYLMPKLAFGTAKLDKNDLETILKAALETGYRHIDTASIYDNEKEIGEALKNFTEQGFIRREEIFITTKIWPSDYRNIKEACIQSLSKLKVEYIDLLLLHWPVSLKPDYKSIPNPSQKLDRYPLHKVWAQLESVKASGLVHSIGVSNWSISLLNDLLSYSQIPPSVNQIEINPFHNQLSLINFCQEHSIYVMGYRIIFSPPVDWTGFNESILKIPQISSLSTKLCKTPAQICLAWCAKLGCGVVVKSSSSERMKENLLALELEISDEDVQVVNSVEQKGYFTDLAYSFGIYVFK